MKFACAIPIYHPTEEQLGHVDIYTKLFECVYVYDNTECAQNKTLVFKGGQVLGI